jgi:GH24 family phage-related lysozyme (muramidase)
MEEKPHHKTRKHMRAIRDDVAAKNLSDVPAQLRSMKSLWEGSGQGGLLERRDQEAALFEEGIR